MNKESKQERSRRIIAQLKEKYPDTDPFDFDGLGYHFVAETEPSKKHPEYDRAIEVIFRSKPHKHLKTTQRYKVLSGNLNFHMDDRVITLKEGEVHTITPNVIHWAESDDGCWVEIYSTPGWTQEDHIPAP